MMNTTNKQLPLLFRTFVLQFIEYSLQYTHCLQHAYMHHLLHLNYLHYYYASKH